MRENLRRESSCLACNYGITNLGSCSIYLVIVINLWTEKRQRWSRCCMHLYRILMLDKLKCVAEHHGKLEANKLAPTKMLRSFA